MDLKENKNVLNDRIDDTDEYLLIDDIYEPAVTYYIASHIEPGN